MSRSIDDRWWTQISRWLTTWWPQICHIFWWPQICHISRGCNCWKHQPCQVLLWHWSDSSHLLTLFVFVLLFSTLRFQVLLWHCQCHWWQFSQPFHSFQVDSKASQPNTPVLVTDVFYMDSRSHMGQFLQGGENGRFASLFLKSRALVWLNRKR